MICHFCNNELVIRELSIFCQVCPGKPCYTYTNNYYSSPNSEIMCMTYVHPTQPYLLIYWFNHNDVHVFTNNNHSFIYQTSFDHLLTPTEVLDFFNKILKMKAFL